VNSHIWLYHLTDDHHLGYIKNLKEEKNTGFAIRILTKELINSLGFDSQ
jgi:hypothetical protein